MRYYRGKKPAGAHFSLRVLSCILANQAPTCDTVHSVHSADAVAATFSVNLYFFNSITCEFWTRFYKTVIFSVLFMPLGVWGGKAWCGRGWTGKRQYQNVFCILLHKSLSDLSLQISQTKDQNFGCKLESDIFDKLSMEIFLISFKSLVVFSLL